MPWPIGQGIVTLGVPEEVSWSRIGKGLGNGHGQLRGGVDPMFGHGALNELQRLTFVLCSS